MTGNKSSDAKYIPLCSAEDPKTGALCLAPLLSFDIAEDGGTPPAESYSLDEAVMLVLTGAADAVGDQFGQVVLTRDRCERLADLSHLSEGKHDVPLELRSLKRWVIWKKLWDEEKSEYEKPPHSPLSGLRIGAVRKNEAHFVDFDTAVAAALNFEADGIGFVFLDTDPYAGVDFDDVIVNGEIIPQAATWLQWLPTYTEISPSGNGFKTICRGSLAKGVTATPLPGAKEGTVELYDTGRYFTVTGRSIGKHTTIGDCQVGITKLLEHLKVNVPTVANAAPNKNERIYAQYEVRRTHKKNLDTLRAMTRPDDSQNDTLNRCAFFAARAFAAKALEGTEEEIKAELRRVAELTKYCPSIDSTIASGWSSGASVGALQVRAYVMALSSEQYCAEAPKETPYIVNGMIYQGTANQLMGPIKDGKTTMLLAMIRNVLAGMDFIGQKTQPMNILYVTEQPRPSFQNQLTRSGLDRKDLLEPRAASLYVLDLGHLWNLNWEGRVDTIRENAEKWDIGLVIIDTFPRIALVEEIQDAGEMNRRFELIAPLVVADNRTLLMGWHERKAGGSISEAAAGTAASGGAVDMLLRLRRSQGSKQKLNSRERQLELVGRLPTAFEESTVITLTNDMSNYRVVGPKGDAVRKNVEQQVLSLLPQQPPGFCVAEIMERLSGKAQEEDVKAPAESTVKRALEKMLEGGFIVQMGEGGNGRRGSADHYRYHARVAY